MLYNATTMCTLWHTVAARNTELLRYQTDQVAQLPKTYSFLNYVRCHDDIGWGLDFRFLADRGMKEVDHKRFLNDYYLGNLSYSTSTGELYNEDPMTGDARFCGTTASMCGIERGGFEGNPDKVAVGIQLDLMLHAFLMFQSGIPVIYSGDEIGAINDWSYHEDPLKAQDSRYLHRGRFNWELTKNIGDGHSVQDRVHTGLLELERARRSDDIFAGDAQVYTIETHNNAVLGMLRSKGEERIIGLFNFSGEAQEVYIVEFADGYRDFLGKKRRMQQERLTLQPYEYVWALHRDS